QILGREGKYSLVRLTSGEVRLVLSTCRATIGQVGNIEHELLTVGKAGRSRWLGKRSAVRGSVMNPNDHHTVVVKDVRQSGLNHLYHLGVNQPLVTKHVNVINHPINISFVNVKNNGIARREIIPVCQSRREAYPWVVA